MSDSEEDDDYDDEEEEEEENDEEEDDDEEEEDEDEEGEDDGEDDEGEDDEEGDDADNGDGGGGGWVDKASFARGVFVTRCERLFSSCLRPRVQPDDATAENSDEEADIEALDLPPPDLRVTLHIVSSEDVKVRDYLAGSTPHILIRPDGLAGKRPVRRTVTEWRTPNAAFDETFEIDMCNDELPLRLVIWDHMEEVNDKETLIEATAEYAARSLKGDPREAYMQFVEVPDFDEPPPGSSSGMSDGGGLLRDRKRAMPAFTELPDAPPEDMKQAWFPVRPPPLQKIGGDAFGEATTAASGGFTPIGGLVIGACAQRLDPATGELLDSLGDIVDETEMDRRALQCFLQATSDPPTRVWQPLSNWKDPDVEPDLRLYSGVTCEERYRVRTHDEKTGELLLPELLPRVVKLDVAHSNVRGPILVNWFDGKLGPSLAALHTLYLNGNGLEGNELPRFDQLQCLKTLDLSENSFRGDLHALSLPPSLVVLNLDYNYFKGPVDPAWFSGLPLLTTLRLSGNRLKCEIPKRCWHFMPNLRELGLARCMLEGPVPASVADAKALVHLTVADNEDVDGEVPTSLLELAWLEDVSFAGCARLGDSRGVVEGLRERDVEVQIWGTGIPDPS